jgi:ligand-binding SRPBCC domain-containing protein
MHIYRLEKSLLLKADIEEVWDFFSRPENLNKLTPEDMKFQILGESKPEKMFAGQIICYRISPFAGINFRWTTEITHCENFKYFIDEQRFGPYSFWHHLHRYTETKDGVLMHDVVHYALPAGFIGRIMHKLFIKKKLEEIFAYREKAALKLPFNQR